MNRAAHRLKGCIPLGKRQEKLNSHKQVVEPYIRNRTYETVILNRGMPESVQLRFTYYSLYPQLIVTESDKVRPCLKCSCAKKSINDNDDVRREEEHLDQQMDHPGRKSCLTSRRVWSQPSSLRVNFPRVSLSI